MPAVNVVIGAAAPPTGHYLQWGVLSISLANLLIILVMIVIFVLALVIPFPGHRNHGPRDRSGS